MIRLFVGERNKILLDGWQKKKIPYRSLVRYGTGTGTIKGLPSERNTYRTILQSNIFPMWNTYVLVAVPYRKSHRACKVWYILVHYIHLTYVGQTGIHTYERSFSSSLLVEFRMGIQSKFHQGVSIKFPTNFERWFC